MLTALAIALWVAGGRESRWTLTFRRLRGPSSRKNCSLIDIGNFAGFDGSIGTGDVIAAMQNEQEAESNIYILVVEKRRGLVGVGKKFSLKIRTVVDVGPLTSFLALPRAWIPWRR